MLMRGIPSTLFTGSISVLAAASSTGSLGITESNWATPTTVATVTGTIQPFPGVRPTYADGPAQQAGVMVLANDLTAYLEPVSWTDGAGNTHGLIPETNRLLANGVTYRVKGVKDWGEYVWALLENAS